MAAHQLVNHSHFFKLVTINMASEIWTLMNPSGIPLEESTLEEARPDYLICRVVTATK